MPHKRRAVAAPPRRLRDLRPHRLQIGRAGECTQAFAAGRHEQTRRSTLHGALERAQRPQPKLLSNGAQRERAHRLLQLCDVAAGPRSGSRRLGKRGRVPRKRAEQELRLVSEEHDGGDHVCFLSRLPALSTLRGGHFSRGLQVFQGGIGGRNHLTPIR